MKSKQSFLVILSLIPFFFAAHECHVISRRDVDETMQQTEKKSAPSPQIDLGKQTHFEGDIILPKPKPSDGMKPSAVFDNQIWPTKKIPFVISSVYTKDEVNLILDAMKAYKSRTCIQFIPRTIENDYIEIKKTGSGCYSFVGRVGGMQTVSLDNGCLYSKTIKHELMHAAGFFHEQSRTDRDDYVNIYYDNIQAGKEHNFKKYDAKTVQLLGTTYDIKSIMHYGWNYFAKDDKKPTMTDKNGNRVAPSVEFTTIDLLDLNRLYKCSNYIEWKEQAWKNGRIVSGPNCDIVGSTIRKVNSKKEDCGGLCAIDLTCTVFTWESKGICTLKTGSKQSSETLPLKGATCGWIAEGNSNFPWTDYDNGREKYSFNCDFPGNDIRNVKLSSDTCSKLCNSEPKCTSYFLRNVPGSATDVICYLKSGKSPIARTYSGESNYAYCSMILARI